MERLLGDNGWQWRLLRTVVQGVLGVVVANLDFLTGYWIWDQELRCFVVALVMAVLSPIMAELGKFAESG
ncbi:hypothetical protein AAK967_06800 [Atopobiaceae bacterium 24-176]